MSNSMVKQESPSEPTECLSINSPSEDYIIPKPITHSEVFHIDVHKPVTHSNGKLASKSTECLFINRSPDDGIIPKPITHPDRELVFHFDLHKPITHSNRKLVLCFDGTGDQFNSDNSNVVQFFSMLVKDDPTQLVYYQSGIGTYTIPNIATPLRAKMAKIYDMMFGAHLDTHVMGGYEFLMQNCKPDWEACKGDATNNFADQAGDKICLFGFSRGAYTARALAGMVSKVGIIPTYNYQQVPFAYNMYSRDDEEGWIESHAFKAAFSIDVDIEFVGVWDTVSAVGLIPRTLPFTSANDSIKYFRHALSLDERRVRFKESRFKHMNEADMKKYRITPTTGKETNVEAVWFAGDHCDVGGGNVENNVRNSLARIPLRWMIRECFKADVGILFHPHMFRYVGMNPATLYPRVLKRPVITYDSNKSSSRKDPSANIFTWFWWFLHLKWLTDLFHDKPPAAEKEQDPAKIFSDFVNEEFEDVNDAISKAGDQLEKPNASRWLWWIMEYIPQPVFYHDRYDNDVMVYRINKGKGRDIEHKHDVTYAELEKGIWCLRWIFWLYRFLKEFFYGLSLKHDSVIKVHRSVDIRMKKMKYVPKAKVDWGKAKIEWVD